MISNTMQQPQQEDLDQKSEVRDAIARGQHANPALQRAFERHAKHVQ